MLKRRNFTQQDIDFVKQNYLTMTNRQIGQVLNRTKGTITALLSKLKLRRELDDLVGQEFGKLKVIEVTRNAGGRRAWLCECKCGNKPICLGSRLKNGLCASCGCGRLEAITSKFGDIPGSLFGQIKKNARYRDIEFNITIEEMDSLFKDQNGRCKLSGLPISTGIDQKQRGRICTASLDRKNSSKSYSAENCQWLHKDVNIMKQDYDQKEIIKVCKLIRINYLDIDRKEIDIEYLTNYIKSCKKQAIARHFCFNISLEEITELFNRQGGLCAISGQKLLFDKDSENKISLDRVDSDLPYTFNNLQLVTKMVNYMKWKFPQRYFIELCKLVAEKN